MRVVASEGRPDMDVRVRVPVRDMTAVPTFGGSDLTGGGAGKRGGGPRRAPAEEAWKSDRALRAAMAKSSLPASTTSPDSRLGSSSIWPYIEASILDEVLAHRTTIVFVNSRGLCEKLTARLNDLYAKRMGIARGVDADAPAAPIRSDLGSTADMSTGAPAVIAKAHHGSVSKEKRLQVERELKAGELPCVVATSSLELGIDMGSIDLVLQVALAVGGQRPAAHRAREPPGGRPLDGVIFPRTRTEIIDAAVAAEGMYEGRIEQTALVKNALDVLGQQTAAAVAMDELAADDWFDTVRRAPVFRASATGLRFGAGHAGRPLRDGRFGRVLAAHRVGSRARAAAGASRHAAPGRHVGGHHPRPRDVLGGVAGRRRRARPAARGRAGRRDGVRVASRRHHHVGHQLVAYQRDHARPRDRGVRARALGPSAVLAWRRRGAPAETGRMRGAFLRAVAAGIEGDDAEAEEGGFGVSCAVSERLAADGLDDDAQRNLVELIRSQRAATGIIPDDKTLVVERCEDEQGDWRVLLHSPYGRRVHEPWAMAVSDRIMAIYGYDAQAMAADDGIVLRIPMTETRLPGIELFAFDSDELDRIVRDRVGSTSLFSARFRECAARALLMSPIAPGKRAPLWQQRLKAGQLLEAARREHEFPILVETARECLQDVYDMRALHELMERRRRDRCLWRRRRRCRRAVRGAASVRVRGRAPLRGRPAARRASCCRSTPRCWASCWARLTWATCWTRTIAGVGPACSALLPIGVRAASRARLTCCACSLCPSRRRRACSTPKRTTTGQRTKGAAKWPPKRKRMRCSELRRPSGVYGRVGRQGAPGGRRRCGVSRDALGATIPRKPTRSTAPPANPAKRKPLRDPERSAQREIEGSRAASAESIWRGCAPPLTNCCTLRAHARPFSAEAAAARFGIGVASRPGRGPCRPLRGRRGRAGARLGRDGCSGVCARCRWQRAAPCRR
ncbi:MAG: helicase-related protein [Eggerthella lenta]